MENSKQPAFPFTWTDGEGIEINEDGLTKREYTAIKIFAARVNASPHCTGSLRKDLVEATLKDTDELLKQLEK